MVEMNLQEDVKAKIEAAMPGARVHLRDFTGEGNHLEANIIWSGFAGMTTLEQHRKVYAALEGMVGGESPVHALALKTWTQEPDKSEDPLPGNR
ncbi:MAG: BolA/IbaG family iron-sulfur metabolism protein [Acidobacteria bacterium]|nr:BolA/IbaG family iron-sulfur metabolism protein [Acidobacteriota bacterium]